MQLQLTEFATVHKPRDKNTNQIVAIKKVSVRALHHLCSPSPDTLQ
uniref:Uncharacterized protein n=1 Tax=Anser cygnoides TaxID=8845 RepID=A0A8B9DN10_ANSCY